MPHPPPDTPIVPLVPLDRVAALLRAPFVAAFGRVLDRGVYLRGVEVRAFEGSFAQAVGAAHAVGVGSGHDAVALALRAVGVGAGDEVVVPAMTAFPTAAAVASIGAVPVAADIGEDGLLDAERAEAAIGPRTRAIVPVHLCGAVADMETIRSLARRRGLALVEDAAQAHGATRDGAAAGTAGDAGCFSFYPTKNLGALGDAGCVVTGDPAVAAAVRRLGDGGKDSNGEARNVGGSSRLDEIQAALLLAQLPRLAEWNARRRAIAARYREALHGLVGWPARASDPGHVHHVCVVFVEGRDGVRRELRARGIETGVHYPRTVPAQAAFAAAGGRGGPCPNADRWARRALTLPCHPLVRDDEVERVVAALRRAVAG